MRAHNLINYTKLIFLAILATVSFQAHAGDSDPVVMLQSVADSMIAGLKTHKATLKTKPDVVYSLARRYVVPHADLDLMSQRVLPPSIWKNATAAQRAQFKSEFTTTLIRTYASALSSYQDQVVSFAPVRGGTEGVKSVQVSSQISGSQGEPISVTYQLVRAGSAWKLVDLSVEGVDMLESFRSQFADILSSGNMDELLRRMSQHNTR